MLFLYKPTLCADRHGDFKVEFELQLSAQSERIWVVELAGKCSRNKGKYACTCCRTETAVNLFGVVNFQLIGRKLTISVIHCSRVQTHLL